MSVHTITKGVGTPKWMAPEVCVHLSLLPGYQRKITECHSVLGPVHCNFHIVISYWHGLTSISKLMSVCNTGWHMDPQSPGTSYVTLTFLLFIYAAGA